MVFSKLLLILRKVGIFRYGVKKYTYTHGKDMPAEALLDDVYNSEKDLVTKKDMKKLLSRKKRKER